MISLPMKINKGFTLIEALIAIAILGAALLPIMALMSQSINQVHKIAESNAKSAAKDSALAIIEPINPMENPSGEVEMVGFTVVWSSEQIVPPNSTVQIGAGLAGYRVAFYIVHIEILKNNEPWFSFQARKVGHKRIQNSTNPFSDTVR